jgi:hypothetical protein
MSELRPLGDFDLVVPDTWLPVPDEGRPGWTEVAAERLCDGRKARAKLARRLEGMHPALTANGHLMVQVWVPDRASAEVAGLLFVDGVAPAEKVRLDREYYRRLIEPDLRRNVRVFAHYVDGVELPAGSALLVSEIVAEPKPDRWLPLTKEVREKLTYVVFPRGCSDALKLTFTALEEFGEKLEIDAVSIMEALTVSLGEVHTS